MKPALRLLRGHGTASDYAARLLGSLGIPVRRERGPADPHPALDWASSGAMALTGAPDGPPRMAPGPLAACARGALAALRALTGPGPLDALDGPALLGERAAYAKLKRAGSCSPGGACRMIHVSDGWLALSLPRADDVALLEAWLQEPSLRARSRGEPVRETTWSALARFAAGRTLGELLERGRILGLALAACRPPPLSPPPWQRSTRLRAARPRPGSTGGVSTAARGLRVVDLSSLWAGPLCGHLLQQVGARILKVESTRRPDAARDGPAGFFDLLHGGQESVALDLSIETGRRALHSLLEHADLVIESSRPRALAQLGVDASEWVAAASGRTWLSITGYGRAMPQGGWVAFGDDAAVAAGLACATARMHGLAAPIFCGDAIADPLCGLHAALACMASWLAGGGLLLEVALRDVVAQALTTPSTHSAATLHASRDEGRGSGAGSCWQVCSDGASAPVLEPHGRSPMTRARSLGADTSAVLRELGVAC